MSDKSGKNVKSKKKSKSATTQTTNIQPNLVNKKTKVILKKIPVDRCKETKVDENLPVDDELEENQLMWSELREHLLYLYKISREQNLTATTVDRIKYLIDTLCTKDIHQLFIRMELLATDVITTWFDSAEQMFANEIRTCSTAYNYLENIIGDCESYLIAARKMLPMLRSLESHLRKFNMCWVLLHQNIFRVWYLEDERCVLKIEKCKLLLMADAETIMNFARFHEVCNNLSEEWIQATKKLQHFRNSYEVYKNYGEYFTTSWQYFPGTANKNKKKSNEKAATESSAVQQKITTTEQKMAELKEKSRETSADLMPRPLLGEVGASSVRLDNRDVDELVAFVEGLQIDQNSDQVDSVIKKLRKKLKKEKQRLKRIEGLMKQEDEVVELMKRSPGVTVTMVQEPHHSVCHHSTEIFRVLKGKEKEPSPTPAVSASTAVQPTGHTPGSRMVTIRRITEANTDEPTVTITLKGPTPDQDQVLYRIINGQADYGQNVNKDNTNNSKKAQKKQKVKKKEEQPKNSKLIPGDLRLPAGITITKVTAAQNQNKIDQGPKLDVFVEPQPVPQQHETISNGDESKEQQRSSNQNSIDVPAKFILAPDGRIIIRSPMAARSTTPPLKPITMIRQDIDMNVPVAPSVSSPFWNRNDWWLPGTTDNVFAPKDIDLEDNTLDAAERELEAFKRFCQEPVPPQRQEVTHLNVDKIVIKKNNQSHS